VPDESPSIQLELLGNLREERRAELARELTRELARLDGVSAAPAAERAPARVRSGAEVPLLGQIALGLISSGAVLSLVKCLRVYLEREPRLHFRMKRKDGAKFELDAQHLSQDQLERTLAAFREFMRDAPALEAPAVEAPERTETGAPNETPTVKGTPDRGT